MTRRIRHSFAISCVCALAVVVGVLSADGASAATATPAPQGFVGIISPDVLGDSPTAQAAELAAMHTAGITLLRQVFDWSRIETSPGVYDFAAYDSLVADAAEHGIEVMPILFNEPAFLSARPKHNKKHGTYPPKNLSSIAAFATAAVNWYGPNGLFWTDNPSIPKMPITIWQIWDEENLNVYWLPKANPAQYVALLTAADGAIHAADPTAEVVSGGIPQSPLPGIKLLKYLRAFLNDGGAGAMDTLGVNAYAPTAHGVLKLLAGVRNTLNAGGADTTPIRISEFGWSDVGPGSRFRAGVKGQAKNIATVIPLLGAAQTTLSLQGFVYYAWRDEPPYPGAGNFWGLHTGLLRRNGTKKPSYNAFVTAVAAL